MTAPTDRPTPGPWEVCDDGVNVYAPDTDTAITDAQHICAPDYDQACANARLIASAPELLAERDALREQVKTLREAASMSLSVLLAVANGETDDYPERCRAAATCARAALASTETEVQP